MAKARADLLADLLEECADLLAEGQNASRLALIYWRFCADLLAAPIDQGSTALVYWRNLERYSRESAGALEHVEDFPQAGHIICGKAAENL